MLRSIATELKYPVLTQVITTIFIICTLLALINLYGLQRKAENAYTFYQTTYKTYQEQGLPVDDMLLEPLHVEKTNGMELIDNPIRYHFEEVGTLLLLLHSSHVITPSLEWLGFVFFPLLFALYGAYIATYDYKHQTLKLKAIRTSWSRLLTSKLVALYLSILLIILATLAVSYAASFWFYRQAAAHIPPEIMQAATLPDTVSWIWQLLFITGISYLFASLGFTMGILLRGFVIPMIIFFTYNLIIPTLGAFDPVNLVAVLAHQLFDFRGRFQLFTPIPVSVWTAGAILPLLFLLSTAIAYKLFSRQSKYY